MIISSAFKRAVNKSLSVTSILPSSVSKHRITIVRNLHDIIISNIVDYLHWSEDTVDDIRIHLFDDVSETDLHVRVNLSPQGQLNDYRC